jgi:hypothetical protein
MTVNGADVASFQSKTPTGLGFLGIRRTYGTWHDPMYPTHLANANKAGEIPFPYHFGTSFTSGATQAKVFLDAIGTASLVALDLETESGKVPMSQTEARAFIAATKAAGRFTLLYHSLSRFPSLGQDGNWVAAWGLTPTIPYLFHQYRGSPLDLDRFNGDIAALRALAGKPLPPVSLHYHAMVKTPTALWNPTTRMWVYNRSKIPAGTQLIVRGRMFKNVSPQKVDCLAVSGPAYGGYMVPAIAVRLGALVP